MSYMHINNLYKDNTVLMFKQIIASEKVHGTSAHVAYNAETDSLTFFSGWAKHEAFLKVFDPEALLTVFRQNAVEHGVKKIVVYGEAYGGSMQGMSHTYGPNLMFIAFEVCVDDYWMDPMQAERVATRLGFEFVPYRIIDATEEAINAEMFSDSEVAIRRGMGTGHMREGVVLRPLVELQLQNGGRLIVKHKRPEFAERESTPKISDPEKQKILEDAQAIADEWVNAVRLEHVLDAFPDVQMADMNKVIHAMIEDVEREAEGEIVTGKEVRSAIGKKTAKLLKSRIVGGTFGKD
jgi:hypothetical protein